MTLSHLLLSWLIVNELALVLLLTRSRDYEVWHD